MPRKQRLRRRSVGYTAPHRMQLRLRWDYFSDAFGDGPESLAAMRKAWQEIGESVTAEHISEKPGTRPWAWWQWASPEPRNESETQPEQLERLNLCSAAELHQLSRKDAPHVDEN